MNRQEIEEEIGLYMGTGMGTKTQLYSKMTKDPKTGEWVLFYHCGK
jgi:hypothetical protein